MLYPIVGYVTRDLSGVSWAHITYVGKDGDLHDLVRRQGARKHWTYGTNITASANRIINIANSEPTGGNTGWSPVPTVEGSIGASVIATGVSSVSAQIIVYFGADDNLHAIFPVSQGFYWPGTPGASPDAGNEPPEQPQSGPDEPSNSAPTESFFGESGSDLQPGDGPDLPGGDDSGVTITPSPPAWADTILAGVNTDPPSGASSPLAVFSSGPFGQSSTAVYLGQYYSLSAVSATGPFPWTAPANISAMAKVNAGPDASGTFETAGSSEFVFSVNRDGQVIELSSEFEGAGSLWSSRSVQQHVTHLDPLPKGVLAPKSIAPRAMAGSPTAAFFNGASNVAYIDADGHNIHLCTSNQDNTWNIADITAAAISPAPRSEVGILQYPVTKPAILLAWTSDRTHVVYTAASDTVVDIWNEAGDWYWGVPNTETNGSSKNPADYSVNLATGMSAFVWNEEDSDFLVYITNENEIAVLSLKHGSSAPKSGLSSGLPWTCTNVTSQVRSHSGYVAPKTVA